jgi:dipeptidyl aminopeptidase/acylaminoacyl peptidase
MRLVLLLVGAVLLTAAPSAWTPELSLEFQTIGAVVPSADGKLVAWVQTKPVVETERSEQVSQIWLAGADGSRRIQLTRGEHSSTTPQFSPDARYIYFLSSRGGKNAIYRIRTAGGEAEPLSALKGAVSAFDLSPDGKHVAFTGYEPPADEEKAKKEKRDFRVIDANPENHALYLIPAEPDADGKRNQKKLADKYHVAELRWSPDSRSIAFSHWPAPLADNWTRSDIAEVNIGTGAIQELAATGAAESQPFYSPDGRYLAYLRSENPPRWPGNERIVLLTRNGGSARELPVTRDEQPALLGWSKDSTHLYFLEAKGTRNALYSMPVDGPPTVVYEPMRGAMGFGGQLNSSGTHMGLAQETPEEPAEAFVLALGSGGPVRVSRANTDVPKPPMGRTEAVRWKSKDGTQVEGLLTLPVNYERGKRYPLVLNIHGGPAGVFSETFTGRLSPYPLAAFSARGWAILRPNPRGSDGYGREFRFANVNDWGGKDYEDDQAGVDQMIESGIADPDRLAVMGWSYGGFMTSWTITQTKRFKAAAIGAGVTNLWSFTGTADIPGFLPDYFGGEPWDRIEAFQKHSPITYVRNVSTPTLIVHGEADDRVPLSQGYEFYHALQRQGVTTKMVVYPRQAHGPREPKFLLDLMHRHLDWMETYVR